MHTVKTFGQQHQFSGNSHCPICNDTVQPGTPGRTVVVRNSERHEDEYYFVCLACYNQGKDWIEQVLNHHQQ